MREEGAERYGCARALRIGCITLLVLLALGTAAVVLNWGRLTSLVDIAKESFADLQAAQAAVIERYDAEDVRIGLTGQAGEGGRLLLTVTLVNPVFVEGADAMTLEERAREVALTAMRASSTPERFPQIEVELVSASAGATGLSSRRSFRFAAEELQRALEEEGQARPELSPDASGSAAQPGSEP